MYVPYVPFHTPFLRVFLHAGSDVTGTDITRSDVTKSVAMGTTHKVMTSQRHYVVLLP